MTQDQLEKDLEKDTVEPEELYGTDDQIVSVGTAIQSFDLPLATGSTFVLHEVLKRGPVIVNFIKGTWCPYCQLHLGNLRRWQEKILESNRQAQTTILIVSNEPLQAIRSWLKLNPVPYLFASDETQTVAQQFGVTLSPQEFLKPATFLVDSDGSVRMAFAGRRKEIPLEELGAVSS